MKINLFQRFIIGCGSAAVLIVGAGVGGTCSFIGVICFFTGLFFVFKGNRPKEESQ